MIENYINLLVRTLLKRYSPYSVTFDMGFSTQDRDWGATLTAIGRPESDAVAVFSGNGKTIEEALKTLGDKVLEDLADQHGTFD